MVDIPIRVYVDTSIFGGIFDREFAYPSRVFFDQALGGRFQMAISSLVHDEMASAPARVREFFRDMLRYTQEVPITDDATELQWAYLRAGVVAEQWAEDALHVAVATVSTCSVIVSWNYRHIVHFEKIVRYNEVNTANGYAGIQNLLPARGSLVCRRRLIASR